MAVNENIYGAANQWYNSSFQQAALTKKNKVAYFGENIIDRTLEKGVTAGKLSYNSGIDKSLSYCGLGSECALSHIAYAANKSGNVSIIDRQERETTNFAFFEKSSSAEIEALTVYNFSDLRYIAWNAALNVNNYQFNRYLAPLTKIIPENVVLAINVYAAKNDYTDISVFPLNTYLQASTHNTRPKIISVYVEAYIGNYAENVIPRETLGGVPFGRYYVPFHLGLLDEYKIDSENTQFFSYAFYHQSVFGNFSNSATLANSNDFMPIAYTNNSYPHIRCEKINNTCYAATDYYPEFEQDILKTVACFGLYFTGDLQVAAYGNLTHNNMYIGILDSDGVGRGKYLRGAETANAPQNTWADMSLSGYDYKTTDNTDYKNNTQFYGTWSSNAFTKMYVLTDSQVSALANELYTAVSAAPSGEEIERYNQSVFLTQNPIDCIISLKKFPMNLPYSAAVPMKLGSYTTTVNAAPLLYSTGIYSFTFSNSSDNGLYQWFNNSFLDYEPYTKCELTIPFCGTVEIPTTYLHDYDTIDVKLIVDFITGACTAYIQARNITIDSVSGECAVTLPVNGLQSATLDSQIHSAATARNKSALTNGLGLIGGLAAVGIGIATGGIGTAVIGGIAALTSGANMITQDKNIEYELQHMQVPMKQVSGASGAINQSYDMRCKMRITRPKILGSYDAEVYANTVGFACLINTTVSSLSGLTVGDINLDGLDASDVEKQLIKNAFASGVIL